MAKKFKSITELFGYPPNDIGEIAVDVTQRNLCPFTNRQCTKTSHDKRKVYGVCSVNAGVSPAPKPDVIVCPKRFYGKDYEVLGRLATSIWGTSIDFIAGGDISELLNKLSASTATVAVVALGSDSGKEIRIGKRPRFSIDWVLQSYVRKEGLRVPKEFVAVEVQSTDIIGNYRQNQSYFRDLRLGKSPAQKRPPQSQHGLNWANVYKRLIPQMISKGNVFRDSERCVGFFVITCSSVLEKIFDIIGELEPQPTYSRENVSIITYSLGVEARLGTIRTLVETGLVHFSLDDVIKGFTSNESHVSHMELDEVLRDVL